MIFRDRKDAGRQLAERLSPLKGDPNVIVLGIPRGGVVVAAEIARELDAPLDVLIAHKIGLPENPEFAVGAVTSTGEVYIDEETLDELKIDRDEIARAVEKWGDEVAHRVAIFRGGRAPLDVKGKIAIVVDDGIATGSTMFAAVRAVKKQQPMQLILAIPVGPAETIEQLRNECDRVVVLETPIPFWAVGRFYVRFEQTEDSEVIISLNDAQRRMSSQTAH
jgi:putative phosphoribosyl transferase